MIQACFFECGEILKSDFPKRFSMERFVPVLPINGQRVFVMTQEKQSVGEVHLDENQVVPFLFLDPVANLINETLSLFAFCASLRELAIQDQVEGKTAERTKRVLLIVRYP